MQRLFSTFADGWPGAGLLLQRLLVGATLVYIDFACLSLTPVCSFAVMKSIGALAGVLLIVGLWTPIVGILAAGVETWIALSATGNAGIPVVLAVLGLTLAMIGPGRWSADARLFGRRHIAFPES
jgi:putative oxidoreductase